MPISPSPISDRLGLCQWFHFQDESTVQAVIDDLSELGLHRLRTGISWADYHRAGGEEWIDYQMGALADAGIEVLLSIWHTPPSLSENGRCSGPPRRLRDYADFVDHIIRRHRGQFEALELWNEPNNRIKWDFLAHDPHWSKFAEMIGAAACWARKCGISTVLGGMIPVDPSWLKGLQQRGVLEFIDVVAIHGFPGMWDGDSYWWDWPRFWHGWNEKVADLRPVCGHAPIWITETGFATTHSVQSNDYEQQVRRLLDALSAPVERVYWYCVRDLDPQRACIEMTEDAGRIDVREYHLGLKTVKGNRKPAWHELSRLLESQRAGASLS